MTAPKLDVARLPHRTVPALLWASAARAPDSTFLDVLEHDGTGPVRRQITYRAFQRLVRSAAAWLRAREIGPGDRILLFAENSPEWQVFAIAATLVGAEPAAAFANLHGEPVRDILARTRPRVLVLSTRAQWEKLGDAGGASCVLSREPLTPGIPNTTWAEALATEPLPEGEAQRLVDAVEERRPFLLIFTSGTTGRQKGVPVTQGAFVHTLDNFRRCTRMGADDVGLMFLPYAHIAGQAQFHLAHATGHRLIHVGRRDDLMQGFAAGPTYALSVPLIYERILEGVQNEVRSKPSILRALLQEAMDAAARVRCDGSRAIRDRVLTALFDRTIGRSVHAKLGGRIRALFAGGAPTPPHLWRFFESLGRPYVQAYGMSETAALISTHAIDLPRTGDAVGYLSPDIEARLAEDGELCIRGPLVFGGYLDSADDRAAFTTDGFFRTGDRATLGEDGLLRLQGRKKNLIVLSTGKKIAPEPVEEQLASAAPVSAAVLIGDGRPYATAALFVPVEQLATLGAHPEERLLALAKERLRSFSGYERPQRILLVRGTLQDHPDLLTPSFKLKRDAFLKRWALEIERLYEGNERASA